MNILIPEHAREVLEHAAEFLKVDLGQPEILYVIEDARLSQIAFSIGGRSPRIEEPVGILRIEDFVMPEKTAVEKPLPNPPHPADGEGIKAETAALCEICGSEIIGKNKGAKVCSSKACAAERQRRYARAGHLRKLRQQSETTIGRDLDEVEEAGPEPEIPLANGNNPE